MACNTHTKSAWPLLSIFFESVQSPLRPPPVTAMTIIITLTATVNCPLPCTFSQQTHNTIRTFQVGRLRLRESGGGQDHTRRDRIWTQVYKQTPLSFPWGISWMKPADKEVTFRTGPQWSVPVFSGFTFLRGEVNLNEQMPIKGKYSWSWRELGMWRKETKILLVEGLVQR